MTKPGYHFRGRRLAVFVLVAAFLVCAGVGTVSAQEQVSNAQELQDVRNDLDDDYVLTDDIDLSGVSNFDPIGDFNSPFTGTFDGDGHNITGLTIDRPDELDVGLFGGVGPGGKVKNVSVRNVDVSGGQWVGALVGTNEGELRNASATGDVVAANRTGGLVGTNTPSARVVESYAKGNVTAELIAGGLAGTNEGDISRSYADVSVAGFTNIQAFDMGGLVGVNVGDVTESYARGEVLGDVSVGGLVGASDGEIVESYATGEVVGSVDTGGLVGNLSFGFRQTTLRDSYWDTEETNQQDAAGVQFGSATVQNVDGLSTEEMFGDAAPGNMTAFDFTNTWATVTNPDGYPVLAWQVEDGEDGDGDGDGDGGGSDGTIDNVQTSLSDADGDGLPDRVQADVTVSNVSSGQTIVELGESNFDVDVSPTDRNQASFVRLQDPDGDGTNETVEFIAFGTADATYTVVANMSNQTAGETGTVNVTLGDGTTSLTMFTVESASGPLDPNNPFGDSNNDPVDRRTVIDRVIEWNMNGTIGGTPFNRRQIIDFVIEWNTAT